MHKKSIYFLINSLEWGGAERVTTNFANIAVQEWKEVYIITLKSTNFYDLPQWVHHLSLSHIKNNILMFLLVPWYAWKFKHVMKKYHLSEGMSLLEVANFVHILARKDAVISLRVHISVFQWFFGGIQKFLIRWLYPKAKKIIVNSEENRYSIAEFLHFPLDRVEILYNPVDKEKIKMLQQEKLDEDVIKKITWKKVFITTWRLVWQKHHEKIIWTLKLLYDSGDKNWIYLIVGDWSERKKLEKQTTKLWLQNHILFCGEQKNVFKYLNVADLFIYASEAEWFPNVLLEAKEVWLPIITSDFKSGAKEVILGEYTKDIWKYMKYPYHGKYWILLDLHNYEHQFLEVYRNTWN